MNMKTQIKIIKIVNIILLAFIIVTVYFVAVKWQSVGKQDVIAGKLTYLKSESKPDDPHVGVYLKLTLENPKYAKFGDGGYAGFLIIANNTVGVGIFLTNITENERDGFIVDVEDNNHNDVIDSGDIFHIYGRKMNGYKISFTMTLVNGNIHTFIPLNTNVVES